MQALGLIETVGYLTAVSAADAAVKAADVEIIGIEKVIGVNGYLGVTVHFSGDVAAVKSAVDAGKDAAERIGKVISSHVIPRAHTEIATKLISKFKLEDNSLLNNDQPINAINEQIDKTLIQNEPSSDLDLTSNNQIDHEGGNNNG